MFIFDLKSFVVFDHPRYLIKKKELKKREFIKIYIIPFLCCSSSSIGFEREEGRFMY